MQESEHCALGDRLIQLLIKGILYESCVSFCQQKATSSRSSTSHTEMKFQSVLNGSAFTDSDLSLLSWLESVPQEIFSCPFEQKTLNIDVQKLDKPSLEAAWAEQILATPIKPKKFPHSAMPYAKSRSVASELMSRSLAPNLEGLLCSNKHLMTMSVGDLAAMSRSFAGFHLSNKKSMNMSVDRLFSDSDVFSNSYADLPSIMETPSPATSVNDGSSRIIVDDNKDTSAESDKERSIGRTMSDTSYVNISNLSMMLDDSSISKDMSESKCDLLHEFQRQKQLLLDEVEAANVSLIWLTDLGRYHNINIP